ncbi:UNVERIFIED_CONTAM: hypothetical protein HDU68_004154 [Siphonaria sp. JEL0065]|nr:hypothetical protein HDU68_004154 [Siphonaria sp. JEL0065]
MNYHAWTYRWKILRTETTPFAFRLIAFQDTKKYIQSHISEHSAFAHALSVLELILSDPSGQEESLRLLEGEVAFAMKLIVKYPGHRSPWCYLQGLFLIASRLALIGTCNVGSLENALVSDLMLGDTIGQQQELNQQLSEVDVLDWLEVLLKKQETQGGWSVAEGGLTVSLYFFASWVVAASRKVIESRGGDSGSTGTIWYNQTQVALDFQLYLLLRIDNADSVRARIKHNVREAGGWPEFLLKM